MVVVNDGSAYDIAQYLRAQNDLMYLENPSNQGYLITTNKGFEFALSQSDCQSVVLFNNDMLVSGNWLELLVNATEHYGITGYFGAGNVNIEDLSHMEVNKLEFSCALITRAVCENVGLLDARFKKGYYSDDDYCLRAIKKGYTIGLVKNRYNAEHLCGATAGEKRKESIEEGARQFLQKWQGDNHESVREFFKTSFYDSKKIMPENTLVRLLRFLRCK
ncbi:hypothetical protein GNIT_2547 [Glaciecola nitratireducens FR1064]|uniref:Glycosyltransferase 2-like domain-containing protein n=2 Tax=Brumicola TaxID=3160924 RepID=G4QM73_GLANF|nr:hypothetical protein GNIT_2547 [Glaciecola nitratireducens FR1064]